jgi:tetratricopeptide (TPR) repeat protein
MAIPAPAFYITESEIGPKLDKMLASSPQNVSILIAKGELVSLKDPTAAIVWFDKALSIEKNNITALVDKADALYSSGMYDEALVTYERILSLIPNNSSILSDKAWTLVALDKFDLAVQHFDKLLSVYPNNTKYMMGKAHSLESQQKYNDALAIYNDIIRIDRNNHVALLEKADVLTKLSKEDEALKTLKIYFDGFSDNFCGFSLASAREIIDKLPQSEEKERLIQLISNIIQNLPIGGTSCLSSDYLDRFGGKTFLRTFVLKYISD